MAEQQDEIEQRPKHEPRGAGSFCMPVAVLEALLDANATAYEICAYLVLARFTDSTGVYSTAGITAVNTYTGANKTKDGPIAKAIERLKAIRVRTTERVHNGRYGKKSEYTERVTRDDGPILFDRDAWLKHTGEDLEARDGPHQRAKILHVLPDFGEAIGDRVWFGGNLVEGFGKFKQPLKALKNASSAAARLLLTLYRDNDMPQWGGVRPIGAKHGPWVHYEPVAPDATMKQGYGRIIRSKRGGGVATIDPRIGSNEDYFNALNALESSGLAYEVVMVLNRTAKKSKFSTGVEYSSIPDDAEPYYELDARSVHGYKPKGEEGLGGITAKTAGELGAPVALEGGTFDGTYAAIVPSGYGGMIAGIYRLRFRVANPKNAWINSTWATIQQNNREAFEFIQSARSAYKLAPLAAPWDRVEPDMVDPDPETATGKDKASQ